MTMNELNLSIDKTAENVVKLLVEEKMIISTAESCTGGLISGAVTSVSGSSAVIEMGLCSYANRIKNEFLAVPEYILEKYGAVSYQTAYYMAKGIRLLSGSDISVSVTGIAGPTGGTDKKPVGTVYCGISTKKGTMSRLIFTPADDIPDEYKREYIRKMTVLKALRWVESILATTD